jgi:CDGSH iron-sulfur domain-containing protein 3
LHPHRGCFRRSALHHAFDAAEEAAKPTNEKPAQGRPQQDPIGQKVEPGEYWWCACGRSATQPFCDGSHQGTDLTPMKTGIVEAKTITWCGCKHSQSKPFCDGSHRTLA